MKKLQINIFDNELNWKGAIDAIESFVHRTSWHEMPNSELKVSRSAKGVEELQIGRILVVNNQKEKALIIEDMTANLNDQYWQFICIPLKAMLNYRISNPYDSAGGLTWVDRRQSQVMTWLVYDNLIKQTRDPDRYFWNSAKTKNMLKIINPTVPKENGDIISFKVDWNTGYLGDTLINVSKMYGEIEKFPIGWNIYIDDDFTNFIMETYKGTDRTIQQTTVPAVVFSEEFGNIKNATYNYSIKDWRNVAYCLYNDGTTDKESPVGNTEHGATISFNRKEVTFKSSKQVLAEVLNEGRSELNKRPHIENFSAEIINNENTLTTYNKDWFIGDIVTVQSAQILTNQIISIDAQITEIEETYDNGEYSINATFGEGKLTLIQLIKNAIDQKK